MDVNYIKGIEKLSDIDSSFAWNNVTNIQAIYYEIQNDEQLKPFSVLNLILIYKDNNKFYNINIRFRNVTNLYLKNIGGAYNQILGFEIVDKKSDGWSNEQRFMINDYENGIIKFFCSEIEILSINQENSVI